MNVFCCYIFITNVKRDGRSKTLLSLVDPESANVSSVPELPFQEVRNLEFMA